MKSELVSKRMKAVKSKWTKPEKELHNYLKSMKIKHQMHPKIFGNPDILLKEKNILIFYNSCFWHKCLKCWEDISKLNDYWKNRLIKNYKRDKRNHKVLKKEGWEIVIIWGHDFKLNKHKQILSNLS